MIRYCTCVVTIVIGSTLTALADEPIFSGPQVGERLAPFEMEVAVGDDAGTTVDLITGAEGQPILLVFVHGQTRPAFGLTNVLTRYAASRTDDGLHTGVIFLTDDPTSATQWIRRVTPHLTPGIVHGIYRGGVEGPGAYGLNRHVTLTILVAKDGVVTGNFALVQPSLQADGQKILASIVDALGGGEVPSIEELAERRLKGMNRMSDRNDPRMTNLLRGVINQQATPEEVKAAAEAVEQYVSDHQDARKQLGVIAARVVGSGRLNSYGTPPAQEIIRGWAESYGPDAANNEQAQPTAD